ncbi:peptidoglycan D,D-transpeptidase FtsI family protein [Marinospirillum insulare]|uniref:Peptidoglycan D,D-transpeptidase FtsI n=1 Tax=Marinospirillum insulare TaxID=217169 RepID=A0ABQ5ZVU1_9GAMM|nr:penicillin-binding transpeptidase domain-containing protein [Marinospirillum insulare]GLR63150.1 penicillin-binding protein 3 [Marinospirillum insulare]
MSELPASPLRLRLVALLLIPLLLLLIGRMVHLHLLERDFLKRQGDVRTLRVEPLPALRGMITDRHGEPLAVSSPVATLWADPSRLPQDGALLNALAKALGETPLDFFTRLNRYADREFIYLKRQVTPDLAEAVMSLKIPGVYVEDEYKRYYPAGEVAAHLVGFTNVDEQGQEGLELSWDHWLKATPGKKRVLKDLKGRIVRNLAVLQAAHPGQNLTLSLDLRLQYLAYRELKAVVDQHKAVSGSIILLDARNGEVLAMVNQPAFNPNNRSYLDLSRLRNRALVDMFEPGSVIKPLSVAVALQSGQFKTDQVIDTSPGRLHLAGQTIRDFRDYGALTPEGIIVHSSNVGVARMILDLPETLLVDYYSKLGFGRPTGTGFPGEASGVLPGGFGISKITRATLSYGYGLSMTLGQLAQAYMVLADQGRLHPLSLLKVNKPVTSQIFDPQVVAEVLKMMEKVVQPGGTGTRAAIKGYRVAGKTGTVHKIGSDGYQSGDYIATFAGIAPASDPRLVAVVIIDSPDGLEYFGGEVAAPVFSRVVGHALRILDVPPDNPQQVEQEVGGQ